MDIINNFSTQFCNERKPVHERYVKPTELTRADAVDRIRSYISDTARCRVLNTRRRARRARSALKGTARLPRASLSSNAEYDRSGGNLQAPEGLVFDYPKPPAALHTSYRAVTFSEDGHFRKPLTGRTRTCMRQIYPDAAAHGSSKTGRRSTAAFRAAARAFGDQDCLVSCNQGDPWTGKRSYALMSPSADRGSPTFVFDQAYDSSGLPPAPNGARYRLNPEPVTYQNVRSARDIIKR